jgi:hypothetical protein
VKGWVKSQLLHDWRDVLPGLFPYFRDIVFLIIGFIILKFKKIKNSFFAGLILVILILSSLFDILDNYFIGYVIEHAPQGNDFTGTALKIGEIWTNIIGILFLGFAFYISFRIIFLYKEFPNRNSEDS